MHNPCAQPSQAQEAKVREALEKEQAYYEESEVRVAAVVITVLRPLAGVAWTIDRMHACRPFCRTDPGYK